MSFSLNELDFVREYCKNRECDGCSNEDYPCNDLYELLKLKRKLDVIDEIKNRLNRGVKE